MRAIATALLALLMGQAALATWKPEYGKEPIAVQRWYENATIAGWAARERCIEAAKKAGRERADTVAQCSAAFSPAWLRIGVALCCKQAERLKTKFVPGTTKDDWAYYPDPDCTHDGCRVEPIKPDVVHEDRIEPDPKDLVGLTQDQRRAVEAEFEQMRREGVLFIYNGEPSCFWPPEPGT